MGPAAAKGRVSREDVSYVIAAVLEDNGTLERTIEFNNGSTPIASYLEWASARAR